jgi:hypothetical protein
MGELKPCRLTQKVDDCRYVLSDAAKCDICNTCGPAKGRWPDCCKTCSLSVAINRLAHYENTGLTPEKIVELNCRRPASENKPLTLEGLRQMDGEPVYLVINAGESTLEMWVLICVDDVNYPKDKPIVLRNSAGGHDLFFNDKELEQEGIHVYARKPEGSEKA